MSDGSPSPLNARPATLVAGLLLALQVALFVWLSPRGFDTTDESFYLLNYQHWRSLSATTSFFGAVFAPAFALSGESLALIRVFGMALVLASGGLLSRALVMHVAPALPAAARRLWVLVGMACSMLYFGYLSTLRAPSYNLLALCAACCATAALLHLAAPESRLGKRRALRVLYGASLGLCALGKVTSGGLLVLAHLLIVAGFSREWLRRELAALVGWGAVGIVLPFLGLQALHPGWIGAVRESLALTATTDGRGVLLLAQAARWEVQRFPAVFWLLAAVCLGLLATWRRWRPAGRVAQAWVCAVVAAAAAWIATGPQITLWLPIVCLATWALRALAPPPAAGAPVWPSPTLLAALLLTPLMLSFGTNLPLWQHSQINGVFALLAVVALLAALQAQGQLGTSAAACCAAVLCVPGLVFQWRAAFDDGHTYRLRSALIGHTVPLQLGRQGTAVLVDATSARSLGTLIEAARGAGLPPNAPMLDFTGDGPGLLFALGAEPVGVPWLLGGYGGSTRAAERVLAGQHEARLRSAWLLTSADNPRRITGWQQLLEQRLGRDTHLPAATLVLQAPYRWGGTGTASFEVQLWRPLGAPRPATP